MNNKYVLALWHGAKRDIKNDSLDVDLLFDLIKENPNVPLEDALCLVTKINLELARKARGK